MPIEKENRSIDRLALLEEYEENAAKAKRFKFEFS